MELDSWICPECERHFARDRQAHVCAPPTSLEAYFAKAAPFERPIFEAVRDFLETLGPLHVEPVSVGIFIKSSGSFVELRPKKRWVALSFPLTERVEHPQIARKPIRSGRRWFHVVNLSEPADLDEQVRTWLREAYVDFG